MKLPGTLAELNALAQGTVRRARPGCQTFTCEQCEREFVAYPGSPAAELGWCAECAYTALHDEETHD